MGEVQSDEREARVIFDWLQTNNVGLAWGRRVALKSPFD